MNIPLRRFVKLVTFGTATSIVAGKLWQREVLAFCVPGEGEIPKMGVFKVKISDYAVLAEPWGSVRIGVNPITVSNNPYPDGPFYPILINRDDNGNFFVMDAECTHLGCVVPPFDKGTDMCMRCPCHNSLYTIDGTPFSGPADTNLQPYPFEYDGKDELTIHVPCWGFDTKLAVASESSTARLKLEFAAQKNLRYEVMFSASAKGPWTMTPFANTANGPADQTSLNLSVGAEVTLYVDRVGTTGFYAVTLKTAEV